MQAELLEEATSSSDRESASQQKALICCIPGAFSRALEGRLRECEVKIAGEQEVIEHLSSEWSCLMECERDSELRTELLKNAFNRFESLKYTVLSSVPGIHTLSDFIRKYPDCKVVFIKQSFKLQDFCSTFRRTDWFETNFGIRGPELRSFYWIILPLFMQSFFNIDPPRNLFNSPAKGSDCNSTSGKVIDHFPDPLQSCHTLSNKPP